MTNVEATADAEGAQELVVVVVAELRQARIAGNSNLSTLLQDKMKLLLRLCMRGATSVWKESVAV